MAIRLREDEEFVLNCLAESIGGSWRPGEDPPDAYLETEEFILAIEVSTLTQHARNDSGEQESRASQDEAVVRFADQLNEELGSDVPSGRIVLLNFRSPLKHFNNTKERFRKILADFIKSKDCGVSRYDVNGNQITVNINNDAGRQRKRIVASVQNTRTNRNISAHAAYLLHERITSKSDKCSAISFRPISLALLNDYWLASFDTYRDAMKNYPGTHVFDKIFIINGGGNVCTLYERDS